MNVSQTHHYPYPLTRLFELFSSAEFIENKYTALGARNIKLKTVKLEDDHLLIDSRREIPVNDDTPTVIKKFVGEWNRTRQKEEWNKVEGGWQSRFKIDIASAPVRIQGTMHLFETETGCTNQLSIDVNTSIPFIGDTLCRFIGQNIEQLAEQEQHFISKHLEATEATTP